jgi:small subunit ribosomal protein S21
MLHVDVRDNNVDQALRVLKKKMQREGLLVKKARQAKEGIKRKRKADRIRAAKMGL